MPELFYCGNQWGYTPVGKVVSIPGGYCNPPLNLNTSVNGQYVTFSWTAPHDYLKFVLEYRIPLGSWTAVDVYGVNITLALTANTTYEWRVKTVCELAPLRESIYANGVNVVTGNEIPGCGAIGTASITNMGDFYRLSWAATLNAMYYAVELRIVSPDDTVSWRFNTHRTYYDFTGLVPGTQYEARVGAVCINSTTDIPLVWSAWVPFEAVITNCPPVTALKYTASATSIIIAWPVPAGLNIGDGYNFNIYLDDVLVASSYPLTSFTFLGLNPNTAYNIKVRTNCKQGFSKPYEVNIITGKNACADPTGLSTSAITDTGFTVNWTPAVGVASQELIINNGTPIPLANNVTSYAITGLPSGILATVRIKSVCVGSKSEGATITQQLSGCPVPTGLVVTPGLNKLSIKWNPVANAFYYRVKVTKVAGSVLVYDEFHEVTDIDVEGLLSGTNYLVEVITGCGVKGSEITYSAAASTNSSTLAAPTCENATLSNSVIGQTTYSTDFSFLTGRLTGFIRAEIRTTIGNTLVQGFDLTETGHVDFTGLTYGTGYDVYIYHKDPGSDCVPAAITSFSTTGQCRPPTGLTLSRVDAGAGLINLSLAGTASLDTPPNYSVEYQADGGLWVSAGTISSFPATIVSGIPDGKYKVRIKSNCAGSNGNWVETNFTCPIPVLSVAAVQGNKIILSWTPLVGIKSYFIELNSLITGQKTYSSDNGFIEIPDLSWNTTFYGTVKAICSDTPTYGSSSQFTVSTGKEQGTGENNLCQPVQFTAFIQDCTLTDPKEDDRDEEEGPGDIDPPVLNACSVSQMDWSLISFLFVPVANDPPNDTYFEGVFSIPQNLANGASGALPGGILGLINSVCLPASSATMDLEMLQGGTVNTGNGTLAVNGNITVTGSYTSDGNNTIVLRLKGNYNKV